MLVFERSHKPQVNWGEVQAMSADNVFAGSIPTLYDQYLGSLLFQPYAVT
jgi:hypothetical protein